MNLVLREKVNECQLINGRSDAIVQRFCSMKRSEIERIELTSELAEDISLLWNDPGFQRTFEIGSRGYFMDNLPYFLKRIDEIANVSYNATFEDYVCFCMFVIFTHTMVILI